MPIMSGMKTVGNPLKMLNYLDYAYVGPAEGTPGYFIKLVQEDILKEIPGTNAVQEGNIRATLKKHMLAIYALGLNKGAEIN